MNTRSLGAHGPRVSEIGLGCMGMSDLYGPADDAESVATIHAALDAGVTLLDTGDYYGMGQNELLLREALKGRNREKAVLSVKFGTLRDPGGAWLGMDSRPAAVKTYLAYTLRRLGTDYVDIYRPGRVDLAVPIEETVGAISEMVRAGYVRHVGLSEAGAGTLRRAHAVHPVSDLQIEYSLLSRGIEAEILPACRELGIGVTAYGVLSRGLLSGHWSRERAAGPRDIRGHLPRFSAGNLERNLALVEALREIGRERGATVAQVAIAWVHSPVERTSFPWWGRGAGTVLPRRWGRSPSRWTPAISRGSSAPSRRGPRRGTATMRARWRSWTASGAAREPPMKPKSALMDSRRVPSVRGSMVAAVWLTALTVLTSSGARADEAYSPATHMVSLSAGWTFSPTRFGNDRNGAHFWTASLANTVEHWSVRCQVAHARYADLPIVGFASFTPVGLGARYRITKGRVAPYMEALPEFVFASWGGDHTVDLGFEAGLGVNLRTTAATDLEVGVGYIRSVGYFVHVYDGPSVDLDGLSQLLLRVAVSVRFQRSAK